MYDTHCHLTFPEFRGRIAEVLADAATVGVRGVITISTSSADALAAASIAQEHRNVWFSAGIHPLHCDELIDWDELKRVAAHPKCVAWGELGLDNHYQEPAGLLQRTVLRQQLEFIESCRGDGPAFDKPIVLHCREAFDELLGELRAAPFEHDRYVFHCFTGTPEEARKVLDFGAWISFTGVATFANARGVAEAARAAPADRIMVETDSPFLSPEPVRKVRPNEPKHVVHIARHLAQLRASSYKEFEAVLDSNAERLFGVGGAESK